VVRVVNLRPDAGAVTIARDGTPVTGDVIDLTGTALAAFPGRAELRPWELVTLRLDA
jgi:hypothetical protein